VVDKGGVRVAKKGAYPLWGLMLVVGLLVAASGALGFQLGKLQAGPATRYTVYQHVTVTQGATSMTRGYSCESATRPRDLPDALN